MREEKLLRILNDADDNFVQEASKENASDIKKRVKKQKAKRWLTGSIAACISVIVVLWLFVPYRTKPKSVIWYKNSEYYNVIKYLNEATFELPTYKNNYDCLNYYLDNYKKYGTFEAPLLTGSLPDVSYQPQIYVENTDNQEQGIIEGDCLKRSDKYAYYLNMTWDSEDYIRRFNLYVYSIDGENSECVAKHPLPVEYTAHFAKNDSVLYLSKDCKTLTIVTYGFQAITRFSSYGETYVLNYDVSDPENIKQTGIVKIRGTNLSSRTVNGKLLLFTSFSARDPSFSDKKTFIPYYFEGNKKKFVPAENIIVPENIGGSSYTVVYLIDTETLKVEDNIAILSASGDEYVSSETAFFVRKYTKGGEDLMDVLGVSYDENSLEYEGMVTVNGWTENQYSMSQRGNYFNVVTSTKKETDGKTVYNADFYCIDINSWSVVKKITSFAPVGETVNSVRFTDNKAYVCTSIRVDRFIDPIFVFDLTDIDNITVKRSEDMDGFSSSLVDFTDGTLLGIGVTSDRELKIDIYKEAENTVETICSNVYEIRLFSEEYKSYYIDRENGIFGIAVAYQDQETEKPLLEYWLISFDGSELTVTTRIPIDSWPHETLRAFKDNGYFYVVDDYRMVVSKNGEVVRKSSFYETNK